MDREDFMDIVYSELESDPDNNRANRIIDAADEYAESAQLGTNLAEVGTDTISRQQAIDVAKGPVVMQGIRSRQSATAAAVEAVKCIIVDGLRDLPPAQPKQRTGHWHITDAYPHNVYCSECHKRFAQTHWAVWEDGSLPRNFCPNCGADMREVTT